MPQLSSPPTLPWVQLLPKDNGYYWWKEKDNHREQIVFVYGFHEVLTHPKVLKIGTIQTTLLKDCQGYWSGPLFPPPPNRLG